MDTLKNSAEKETPPQEPYRFQKRHGSTTFIVNVHSSKSSNETANDKIARLIRNDVSLGGIANL